MTANLKYLFIAFTVFIIFILLYLLIAFLLSHIVINRDWKPSNDITMYLLSNGVHVDIVVPVKTSTIDWSTIVKHHHTTGNDTTAQWLGFGWGDKGFYLQTPTWADLKFSVAFRAATGLSTSAMHVTFYKNLFESKRCRKIQISNEEYQKLVKFILSGFQKTSNGDVMHIITDANYGINDAFYEGVGRYHLFKTCNTWTNNALKYSGLKAGVWTPFESGVMHHYK